MLGLTELLQDTVLSSQQRHYLNLIDGSGKALLNIINDILDYSKIAAGKMELENIDLDLDKLCLECASVFSVNADNSNLDLLCSLAPGTPGFIQADPTRLRQILLNLLGNAFKFTRQGGVSLRVQIVADDGGNADGNMLRFEVRDSGIGISAEAQARLFQAFSQADATTTRQYGGTGLGLTISKRLVDLMGGRIGVTSQPGAGSTFWFSIPFQPASAGFINEHQVQTAALHNRRMLICDGRAEYCRMLQEQAQAWGMRTRLALTGAEVLPMLQEAAAQQDPFQWVVLGTRLPDTSGLECARAIQQHPALSHCNCVLLTAVAQTIPDAAIQQAGIRLAIARPPSASTLRQALIQMLGGEQQQAVTAENPPTANLFESKIVLVAEDNNVNQMVIGGMLKKLGIQYEIAANGELALALLTRHYGRYDLVLMDCEMPAMDGYTATRALRSHESKNNLTGKPVIALTAHVMQEHLLKAQAAGMNDHLGKPLEFATLRDSLVTWLLQPATTVQPVPLAK
jgi:CheY-like chemotaxis protein